MGCFDICFASAPRYKSCDKNKPLLTFQRKLMLDIKTTFVTLSIQAITVYFFTRPFLTNTLYSVYLTIPTYTSQAISNKY